MNPEATAVEAPPMPKRAAHNKGKRGQKYQRRDPMDHDRKSWVAVSVETQVKFLYLTGLEINCWFWAARFATPENGYTAGVNHQRAADDLGSNVDSVGKAYRRLQAEGIELLRKKGGGYKGESSVYEVRGIQKLAVPRKDSPAKKQGTALQKSRVIALQKSRVLPCKKAGPTT